MASFIQKSQSKLIALEQTHKEKIARFYMITGLATICFALVLVKRTTQTIFLTIQFRGLMICCFNLYSTNEPLYILSNDQRNLLLLQTFLASFQAFFYFFASRMLSLAEGSTIYLTYALWTQFQANWILKEPLQKSTFRNCALSFFGVILITKPKALLDLFNDDTKSDDHLIGCAAMLFASIIYGLSQILLRLNDLQSIPSVVKLHYFHGWNIILGSLGTIFIQNNSWEIYRVQNMFEMIVISALSFIANFLTIRAFGMISLAKLAPYSFFQIVFALFLDFLIFQTLPDMVAIIGSCFIVLSIILSLTQKPQN